MRKHILVIMLSGLLCACSVGPDYHLPQIHLPESWAASPAKPDEATNAAIATQENWWKHFNDPVLDGLIEKAAAGNFDLKIAQAHIEQARATRSSARSALLPAANMKGTATREENQFPVPFSAPGIKAPFNTFETGFDASWEADLFGGKRRALEVASAQLGAQEASLNDARVSVLAEVARTYIDIRRYQNQIILTQNLIASNQATLDITRKRAAAGDVAQVEVTEAQTRFEQATSQEPQDRNTLAQAEYGMDVLLGVDSGTAHTLVKDTQPVPVLNDTLVLGAPAAIIAQRPDIQIAERQLAAATAQQGVAAAKFFPDISLSGFLGLLSMDTTHLFTASSESWSTSGSVVWPILNLGTLKANEKMADAQQQEALANYQKTIIEALSDVNRAVTAYREQEQRRQSIAQTVAGSERAVNVMRKRYKEGLTPRIDSLESERTLVSAQNRLLEANAQSAQDIIAVYKSLGGGWKQNEK